MISILLSFPFSAVGSDQIYQWKDQFGNIQFGTKPPSHANTKPFNPKNINISEPIVEDKYSQYQTEKKSTVKPKLNDNYCRNKRRELEKVEAHLSHTDNVRDNSKAKVLKHMIKQQCGTSSSGNKTEKVNERHRYCQRQRSQLKKVKDYLKVIDNSIDRRKEKTLTALIKSGCGKKYLP